MGHGHSKEEARLRKLIAEKGLLKLPVGSEVERLFYEDFDADAKEKSLEEAGKTPVTPVPPRSALSRGGDGEEKWKPVKLDRKNDESGREARTLAMKAHVENPSSRSQVSLMAPKDGLSAVVADSMQRTTSEPGRSRNQPEDLTNALCLSQTKSSTAYHDTGLQSHSASSQQSSDPSQWDPNAAALSRWQARISRRISDRQANDEEKLRLSIHNPYYQISEEDRIRLSQITTAYSAITAVGEGWEDRVRFSGSTAAGTADGGKDDGLVKRLSILSGRSSVSAEEEERRI